MSEPFTPGLILILGAALVPLLPLRLRQAYMLLLPALGLWHLWSLTPDASWTVQCFAYQLELVRVDSLSRAFGTIFYIATWLGVVYGLHERDPTQQVMLLAYPGAAIAAAFVGDLISLFLYWELTAITSVFLVWATRSERSYRAGMRYLIVQVGSGVLLLAGALVHLAETGSLAFEHIGLDGAGGWLIFLSFGIKAAFPLLHNWLQDSYPEASAAGTVVLSSFTTKLAIYALARGFAGESILVPIGAAMTAFPVFYAVIENDLRRVLAYSLNNQLGFMVVGIGIGTELSLNGTVAHAFAHILYKSLLFMSMGAVLYRVGTCKGSELGGLYKSMPWTTAFSIVGAASISAFPLFSGFVSKSMIVAASAENHYDIVFVVLLFASAGVFHHSGIKIPFFAFYAHDRGHRVAEAPLHMLLAMALTAALCVGIGVWPAPLYALLPHPVDFVPYTTTHVVTQLQLLLFSALAFGVLQKTGVYPPELRSVNLDVDWFYRRLGPRVAHGTVWLLSRTRDALLPSCLRFWRGFVVRLNRHYGPEGVLGEPWPAGTAALWAAVLLGVYVALHYL